jgi:Family of unknown function (DUF6338)
MVLSAETTTELAKVLLAFFLEGLGATAVVLMPGYLLGIAFSRGLRGPAPSDRAFVANAVAGAIVVHALGLPWTLPLARRVAHDGPGAHAVELTAWALVVLLLMPLVLGAMLAALAEARSRRWWYRLLNKLGVSTATRTAEAWNWVFRQRFPAYMRVRLKDGRTVLGWYGGNSLASSDASVRDLYLQEEWIAERSWFKEPYPTTRGVWVAGSEIVSVEFFTGSPPIQRTDEKDGHDI